MFLFQVLFSLCRRGPEAPPRVAKAEGEREEERTEACDEDK